MIVVDASLAAKLILDEIDSDRAERWYFECTDELVAPDLIVIEVAQAIVRRVNTRKATPNEGREGLRVWRDILNGRGISLIRVSPGQVHAAAELAIGLGHPVKDCVYLALAIEQDATLVTCDAKFASKARSIHPAVRMLSDYAG